MENIILYESPDGKVKVDLLTHDGSVWLMQKDIATLFGTSIPNINMHISNILKEGELHENSVIKYYLITAELRAKRQQTTSMSYWIKNVDSLLTFNDFEVLQGHGSVSNAQMEEEVKTRYETFNARRKALEAAQADREDIAELEACAKKRGDSSPPPQ